MKKYGDDVLNVLGAINGRLSQLESTTHRLERVMTEFKGESEMNQSALGSRFLTVEKQLTEVSRSFLNLRRALKHPLHSGFCPFVLICCLVLHLDLVARRGSLCGNKLSGRHLSHAKNALSILSLM